MGGGGSGLALSVLRLRYGMGVQGSNPDSEKAFYLPRNVQTTLVVTGVLPGGGEIKRTGREADHSPPSSFEVKNGRSYISTSPICVHGTDGGALFLP